jgi:hypothetical protein
MGFGGGAGSGVATGPAASMGSGSTGATGLSGVSMDVSGDIAGAMGPVPTALATAGFFLEAIVVDYQRNTGASRNADQ